MPLASSVHFDIPQEISGLDDVCYTVTTNEMEQLTHGVLDSSDTLSVDLSIVPNHSVQSGDTLFLWASDIEVTGFGSATMFFSKTSAL